MNNYHHQQIPSGVRIQKGPDHTDSRSPVFRNAVVPAWGKAFARGRNDGHRRHFAVLQPGVCRDTECGRIDRRSGS